MKLDLNPNAIVAFDKQAEELTTYVKERPPTKIRPHPPETAPEFHPAANFTSADLTDGIVFSSDLPGGEIVSKWVHRDGKEIALEVDGCKELRGFAEKLQWRPEVRPFVSVKTIEERTFSWLVERHVGNVQKPLMEWLLAEIEPQIVLHQVWVPVFGLYTRFAFEIGRAKIVPMGKQFFDTWEAVLTSRPSPQTPELLRAVAGFRPQLQGLAACLFSMEAEINRAQEIALEEAENSLAILRVFMPNNVNSRTPSYCRPYGRERVEKSLLFLIHNPFPPSWSQGVADDVRPWVLDEALIGLISQAGIGHLHRLYTQQKRTEYQEALLKSVMLYSRSSLQTRISDRLIYIFTALDSFLLQNTSEGIQQNVADRIAFTISEDVDERIEIKDTVIAAYGMRSRAVHHSASDHDVELVNKFLILVFRFYLVLLAHNDDHKTRQDFFDSINRKKYSG